MRGQLRLAALWEQLRGSLWLVPSLFVLLAIAAGTVLALVRPVDYGALGGLVFGGGAEGARNILSVIAGAMITVTGLTFSLTVVALQMSSAQFSPRVLRGFLTDRGNQLVLALLLATFAYSLAVIRLIQEDDGADGEVVPRLAVTVGFLLTLVAVGAIVYFIHHLTQQLRVDKIMDGIVADTLETIDRVYPDPASATVIERALPLRSGPVRRVVTQRSGYLQTVTVDGLVRAARRLDAVVQLRARIGDQVPEGVTLAWVWPCGDEQAERDEEQWRKAAHDHVHLGAERTLQQDVAFGLQQLVDIAARALSPGINDPATAVDALGRLSVLVCRLASRELDIGTRTDTDGQVRLIQPAPSLGDFLDLACDSPRRYGSRDPQVLRAILELLADAAEVAVQVDERPAIERECHRTLEIARGDLDATDMARVSAAAAAVRATLEARARPQPGAEVA